MDYRCEHTQDLETLTGAPPQPDKAIVFIEWNSGRTEKLVWKLNAKKELGKKHQELLARYKAMPTVKKLDVKRTM